jgi:hypothetical protein
MGKCHTIQVWEALKRRTHKDSQLLLLLMVILTCIEGLNTYLI